jgi:hypothetical protein
MMEVIPPLSDGTAETVPFIAAGAVLPGGCRISEREPK